MSEFKFLLFSDFHYKKRMYPATVRNLRFIFDTAMKFGADAVLHAGDFCNDYLGSPEIVNAYLNNDANVAVFGCYGNHELESKNNSMSVVTPLLSNRQQDIIYGTEDGKIGDGSVAYYYTDINGYRFVFLDTDYSVTQSGEFEHNRTCSYGKPKENTRSDSLGDRQIEWLRDVLYDAADRALSCIVVSHASFSGIWKSAPDAEEVRKIFASANEKRNGTVIMAINGHYHTCNCAKIDGVTYFDCPAAINGHWQSEKFYPYAEDDPEDHKYTFDFEDYDENGNLISVFPMSYSKLSMGAQSLFYGNPAYALVTLGDGKAPEIEVSEMYFAYNKTLNR